MNNPSACPHFVHCSGCQTPDLNPPVWQEVLSFFSPLKPHLNIDGFAHTRLKSKLAIRKNCQIGLFRKGSHEVISIPQCLVHHPSINEAISLLQKEIQHHKTSLFSENPPMGNLRYVQSFVEKSTGKVQLSLMLSHPEPNLCESLKKYELFHSIWQNIHETATNNIIKGSWHLFSGKPFLWQTIDDTPVAFHPAAFSQNHLPLFEKIVQKIASYLHPKDRVLELYAGVGAISLPLHKKIEKITLVENNPFAHLSFLQTKSDLPYHCMDAKDFPLTDYDAIIVDPPRKGLDQTLLQKLLVLKNTKLIYLSCGFDSFKRDCEALQNGGWQVQEATGYLLFPGTNHVEILAIFEKSLST